MVNTFLLNVPELRRRKQDSFYKTDLKSLKVIKKYLKKKRLDFQRLDWNIPGNSLHPEGFGRFVVEYLEEDRDEDMRRRLREDKFIVLNSSGFFHHRTYFFVEPLEDICYVQLDSHLDSWNKKGKINGDGFVPAISRLKNVRSAHVLGVTPSEALAPEDKTIEEIRERINGVNFVLSRPLEEMIVEDRNLRGNPNVNYKEVYRKALELYPHLTFDQKPTQFDVDELPDLPVYLSIDLDVIQTFPTFWQDHGRWDTVKVLETIYEIGRKRDIIGADICGLDTNYLENSNGRVMKHYEVIYKYLKYTMGIKNSIDEGDEKNG